MKYLIYCLLVVITLASCIQPPKEIPYFRRIVQIRMNVNGGCLYITRSSYGDKGFFSGTCGKYKIGDVLK